MVNTYPVKIIAMRAFVLLLLVAANPGRANVEHPDRVLTLSLCALLKQIQPGERLSVRTLGIIAIGNEHQMLYDPSETSCRSDLQPATWVGIAVGDDSQLGQILLKDHRAYVTFCCRSAQSS